MKKQLRFLYRYLIAAGHWRHWLNAQTLLIVVVSGIFFAVLYLSTPRSNNSLPGGPGMSAGVGVAVLPANVAQTQAAPLETPTQEAAQSVENSPTPTRTPFPEEFFENADQTAGITLAGVALVLIIFVGVWSMRPRWKE